MVRFHGRPPIFFHPMRGKVIFTTGDPQEREVVAEKDVADNRLYNDIGDPVLVGIRTVPAPPRLIVYLRDPGPQHGLLATIEKGKPRTGEQLHLPLVRKIEVRG